MQYKYVYVHIKKQFPTIFPTGFVLFLLLYKSFFPSDKICQKKTKLSIK